MNINSLARLSELLQKLTGDDRFSSLGYRRFERSDGPPGRAERRRAEEPAPVATPESAADTADPVDSTPVAAEGNESTGSQPPEASELDTLAGLYVKQYQQSAGVTLSEEEFSRKKAEVADFYSKVSNGTERLDAVVFANDTAIEA